MLVPARSILDLGEAQEAFGNETSYYAGTIMVDSRMVDIDGKTDRNSDTWMDDVLEELFLQWGMDAVTEETREIWSLQIHDETSFGNKYLLTTDGNELKIEEIESISEQPPTIWRIHAEKIAEDVAEELSKKWFLSGQVQPGQTIKDWMIELIVRKISETLPMREDL